MTEKTTPELPLTLAEDEDGDTLRLHQYDADDREKSHFVTARSGSRIVTVDVDPAELIRNLAAFVPEVEPVAWMDPDRNVWSEDPNEAGDWKSPAYAYARDIRGLPTPVTALYAHPPVTAEPAREPLAEWEKQLLRDAEIQNLRAKVERYKAALEAADDHATAIEEHWQAVARRDIAMKQVQQAYDTRNAARTHAVAARAAVEAGSSEEAGDE